MLALIFVCFINLLEHTEVLEAIMLNSGSSSSKLPNLPTAYLPPSEYEFHDAKSKRSIFKRSEGRLVTLPADIVEKMKDKPLSYFDPSSEINKKMILDSHNKYRSKANPPACNMLELKWSDEAAKAATAYARKCIQGHSNMTDRTITGYRCGENLLLARFKMTWDVVTDCWFSEYEDFEFAKGSINGKETGHYTQLMWGSSSLVGCGFAECLNLVNKYNFVCMYCPPGNRGIKSIPYKLGKPCGDCPSACANNLCRNACPFMDFFSDCTNYMKGGTCGSDASLITDCPAMCKCNNGEIK